MCLESEGAVLVPAQTLSPPQAHRHRLAEAIGRGPGNHHGAPANGLQPIGVGRQAAA